MMVTVTAYEHSKMEVPVFTVNCSEDMALKVMALLHEKLGFTVFRIR